MSMQGQFVLRGLLAWDLTERESALGLVYLSFGITLLIATPIGGMAADRVARRTVLLICQILISVASGGMALVVLTGVVAMWMLVAAAVVQGIALAFYGPARVAMSAELVGRDQLGNAITLSLLSLNGTRIFAPALAGILAGVQAVGIGGAYLLSCIVSLGGVYQVWRLPHRPPTATSRRNPLAEIRDGVEYVLASPRLKRIMFASFFVIMFGFNYVAFIPALVEGIFGRGDGWVGIVNSAGAIGAVAVAMPLASRADSPAGHRIMVVSGIGFGLGVVLFGLAPTLALTLIIAVFIGACTTAFQSMSNTLVLSQADDEMAGRVQSLMQLSFAGFGIAAAPLGLLAEAVGLRPALVLMGAVAVASVAALGLFERRAAG